MAKRTISTRVDDDLVLRLEALALRHGVDAAEIQRRFFAAGIEANPLTPAEIDRARAARVSRAKGEVPGLVIPLSPVARAAAPATEMEENGVSLPLAHVRLVRRTPAGHPGRIAMAS